jgi:hypothetical protein
MMAGMLPPGVQQLVDSVPTPEQLLNAAGELTSYERVDSTDAEAVAKFLVILAQLLRQNDLIEQSANQTEPLRLECPACHQTYAVDNALQYRRRVQEGWLYGCANEHPATTIGSGRMGELTEDEQNTFESEHKLRVIFPPDYENPSDSE